MKRLVLYFILTYCFLSCKNKASINIYGEYFSPTSSLSIDLLPPNKYLLDSLEFYEDLIINHNRRKGTFKQDGNVVYLINTEKTETYKLELYSEDFLIPHSLPKTQIQDTFLLWTKLDRNGQHIRSGGWENNKRSGTWIFFNVNEERSYEIYYENGIAIDTINVE